MLQFIWFAFILELIELDLLLEPVFMDSWNSINGIELLLVHELMY